ncbi:MAG: glycoside hydrolase family 130 protein [Actinomycetota bacterium]|nr:glycoside hydrolase family 130 protein [Actinomycetota bacterium]
MSSLSVTRHRSARFIADAARVIAKPFLPGEELLPDGSTRMDVALGRLLVMAEADVSATLAATRADFGSRHRDFDAIVDEHFELIAGRCPVPEHISLDRRRLIGAYFTHEYSIEAAALGNPSIVPGPEQSGLPAGACRFVMSLRAIGEGHISSIELRSGVIGDDLSIVVDPPSRFAVTGRRRTATFDRAFFLAKLAELDALDEPAGRVLGGLGPRFTITELEAALRPGDAHPGEAPVSASVVHILHWLASSNYRTEFDPAVELSERVIFPTSVTESRGMEDVRLVRFRHDDGSVIYYGTYTAYDGHTILPQMIETTDFASFRVSTLGGRCAQNKGIALFPRKVGGRFLALGRHDNVNNYLLTSDDIRIWYETEKIQEPERPWELMQLGNCGSPLETEAGWLVITHGVGPMRRYCLGALLLDLDDPSTVIGHLAEPLLAPSPAEREGYVPNVVYSCGSMLHGGHLVLPYGYADVGAGIATVPLDDLLGRLTS